MGPHEKGEQEGCDLSPLVRGLLLKEKGQPPAFTPSSGVAP